MPRVIDAREGLVIVGTEPDDTGIAPSGVRGVTQANDAPLSANTKIPGQGSAPVAPMTDMEDATAFPSRLYGDSYDQQLDEEADDAMLVLKAQEGYTDPDSLMGMTEAEWVALGRRCFNTGRTYYETGWRDEHIKNSFLFRSEHAPDSKYCDPVYKLRSKTFRPATRMAARSWEADVAAALFMNDDYMTVSSEVKGDNTAASSAGVVQELMQIRLRQDMWYQTCIGAAQDAFVNGPVCAKVYWKQEIGMYPQQVSLTDPFTGLNLPGPVEWVTKRTVNQPTVDLIMPEHLIVDPSASWKDPIGTAGYVIHQKVMSVDDVKRKMKSGEWNLHSENEILSCRWAMDDDATKQAKRGEGTPDPNDSDMADRSYETVRVLEVIVKRDGCDYVFDMMGETFLLCAPVPLEVRYHHGRRPFVMGTAMIESHNTMPESKTKIGSQIQHAINDVSNARMDNVRLAMNKRVIVRRGANVDLAGLMKSTPGGVVLTQNPANDILPMEVNDVTASSYQETQQLTTELNELQGTFSAQAVANNREMNETVGGMEMLSSAATKVVDYDIRTFVNTFVEPVLTLFMLNIQYYEDDEMIVNKALGEAGEFPRLQYADLDDDFFTKQLMLRVDTGIGATNPMQRINTLLMAINQVAQLPGMGDHLDSKAVARRIFATCGLGTGEQFFENLANNYQAQPPGEPAVDPLVQAAQEEAKGRIQEEQLRQEAENQRFKLQMEQQVQLKQMDLQAQNELKTLELALKAENHDKDIQSQTWWKLLDNDTRLKVAAAQDKTKRDTVAVQQGSNLRQDAINAVAQIAAQPTSPEEQMNGPQTGE